MASKPCWTREEDLGDYDQAQDAGFGVFLTATKWPPKSDNSDSYVHQPGERIFVNVIRLGTCEVQLRFPLEFPLKMKLKRYLFGLGASYRTNSVFRSPSVAISPDRRMIAVGYSVRKGDIYSDARAYIGIYSIDDGRLMATCEGGLFRNGLIPAIRYGDLHPTHGGPVGNIRFSPDSKTLYGGEGWILKWDLSSLR